MGFDAGAPPPSVWTPSAPCGTTVLVTTQQKTQTLYYIASSGQTLFPLSTADMCGNNVALDRRHGARRVEGRLKARSRRRHGRGRVHRRQPSNTVTRRGPPAPRNPQGRPRLRLARERPRARRPPGPAGAPHRSRSARPRPSSPTARLQRFDSAAAQMYVWFDARRHRSSGFRWSTSSAGRFAARPGRPHRRPCRCPTSRRTGRDLRADASACSQGSGRTSRRAMAISGGAAGRESSGGDRRDLHAGRCRRRAQRGLRRHRDQFGRLHLQRPRMPSRCRRSILTRRPT